MNCMNKITIRGALGFMAVAGCLLYAMFAIAATATDSECEEAWEDAPAEAYCPAEGAMAIANTDKCIIGASQCSIAVEITGSTISGTTQFTPSFPNSWTLNTGGVNLADTDDIDICFKTTNDSIDVKVKAGCDAGEITSSEATKDGITL